MEVNDRYQTTIADRQKLLDPLTPSPTERAAKVYECLKGKDLSQWDIVCFCSEYLSTLIVQHEWIKEAAKRLGKLIYLIHYYHNEELGICPEPTVIVPKSSLGPKELSDLIAQNGLLKEK